MIGILTLEVVNLVVSLLDDDKPFSKWIKREQKQTTLRIIGSQNWWRSKPLFLESPTILRVKTWWLDFQGITSSLLTMLGLKCLDQQ